MVTFPGSSSLTQERLNQIAHAMVEHVLREHFRFRLNGEYSRMLGQAAKELEKHGLSVTVEELHSFHMSKLPRIMGEMFGWDECIITGSDGKVVARHRDRMQNLTD